MENNVERQALTGNVKRDLTESGKLKYMADRQLRGADVVKLPFQCTNKLLGPIMLHSIKSMKTPKISQ